MFVLKIKEVLMLRGYKPTPYSLEMMGIPRVAAKQYFYNRAKSIKLEHLYTLCTALDCTPMELMQVEMPKDFVWQESMSLYPWRSRAVVNPFAVMKTLSVEKMRELNAFLGKEE